MDNDSENKSPILNNGGVSKRRYVVIEEGTLEWSGFDNVYELLGFIDLICQPNRLKQEILGYLREKENAQGQQEGSTRACDRGRAGSQKPCPGDQDSQICVESEGKEG